MERAQHASVREVELQAVREVEGDHPGAGGPTQLARNGPVASEELEEDATLCAAGAPQNALKKPPRGRNRRPARRCQ
eukprot:10636211-Lingulodinium_polyedra.AAC.1